MPAVPKPRKARKPKRAFSSIKRPSFAASVKAAKTRKKKRPAKEQRAKFEREYGGEEYLAFIHAQPCAACRLVGYTEAAHTATGGMGRKADAETLAPLCRWCHLDLHHMGVKSFETTYYPVNLKALAAALWTEFQGAKS